MHSPTWRLDVLGDILLDIQRAQQHAALELFHELSRKNQGWDSNGSCRASGVPAKGWASCCHENVEALIVLDRQFASG